MSRKAFIGKNHRTTADVVWQTLLLTVLVAGPAFGASADEGQWRMPRHDNRLSGHAPGKAAMTQAPVRVTRYELFTPRPDWVFAQDLDGDGSAEILYPGPDGTRVVTAEGELRWTGPPVRPMLVADFDANGTFEILFEDLSLRDGRTGKLLWQSRVPGIPWHRIHAGRFVKRSDAYQIAVVARTERELEASLYDFSSGAAEPTKKWSKAFHTSEVPDECSSAAGFMRGNEEPILAVGVLGGLIVLDLTDGAEIINFEWETAGRKLPNHGQIVLADVFGDAQNEFILLNDIEAQQIAVIQYEDGAPRMVWNEFFGYWPPLSSTGLQVTHNSVVDVDGDGAPDIVLSLWKKTEWELQVREAATGRVKFRAPNTVVHDTVDLDGDGTHEILTTLEPNFMLRDVSGVIPMRGRVVDGKSELARLPTSRYMFQPVFANPVGRGGRHLYNRNVVMGDCDQDGVLEFVYAGCSEGNHEPNSFQAAGIFRGEGPLGSKGNWPVNKVQDFRVMALADLNGDGAADAVTMDKKGLTYNRGSTHQTSGLGTFKAVSNYRASPVVGNLDREGRNEVVVPDGFEKIHVLEFDSDEKSFTAKWETEGFGFGASGDLGPTALITDVKPDDKLEVLSTLQMIPTLVSVRAAAHDGRIRWRCGIPASTWTELWPPIDRVALGNFTGRDYDELYTATRRVRSGRGAHTSTLIHTRFGENYWSDTGRGGEFDAMSLGSDGMPAAYDLNGDGKDDIFLNNLALICCLDGNTGKLLQEPKSFNSIFTDKGIPITSGGSIIPVNVLGDEKPELLSVANVGAMGLMTLDRQPLWHVVLGSADDPAGVHPGLADVDGDGKLDIGLPVKGEFHCYDAVTGKLKWKLTEGDLGRTDVATADIDGDGAAEFLLCGQTDLIAIKADGSTGRVLWRVNVGPEPASPVIANVDDDPELEILVTVRGGELHLFDTAK